MLGVLVRQLNPCVVLWILMYCAIGPILSQAPGTSAEVEVLKGVDEAAYARDRDLIAYTVQERYTVFRRGENSPAAQMIVNTNYARNNGKSFRQVSEDGSATGRLLLHTILQHEKELSQPTNRDKILITSKNYEMSIRNWTQHEVHGRKCLVVAINPRKPSPYLLVGNIWIDASNYHLVRLEGKASASTSFLAGRPTLERDYSDINGFPVAIHAKSISNQAMLGETVVEIDYENYQLNSIVPKH